MSVRNAKGQRDNLAISVGSWVSRMKSYLQVSYPWGGCYPGSFDESVKHLRLKTWCGRSREPLTAQSLFRPGLQLRGPGPCAISQEGFSAGQTIPRKRGKLCLPHLRILPNSEQKLTSRIIKFSFWNQFRHSKKLQKVSEEIMSALHPDSQC